MAPPSSSSTPGNGSSKKQAFTYSEGSPSWNPDAYLADAELHARAEAHLADNDLRAAIATSFSLRKTDTYTYHAMVAVTLPQVQHVVSLGAAHGLHSWYFAEPTTAATPPLPQASTTDADKPPDPNPQAPPPRPPAPTVLPPPPQSDIEAYISIFSPSNAAATALRNFAANAKKGSLRREIGAHLTAKRFIHPSLQSLLSIPRSKPSRPPPPNPYLAFQAWASRNLEWAGPSPSSARAPRPPSHHVLPILMHHFGCVCPSHEALEILRRLAAGREIIDVGSGNGYWTRLLRDYHTYHSPDTPSKPKSKPQPTDPPPLVTPVDSAQSSWRTTWVRDTTIADGAAYLRDARAGARDAVLLLVYPIVGGGVAGGRAGGFTRDLLAAYAGDTLAVVGTQNRNGYTGFRDATMDEFMAREHGREWVRVVQVPLPSFPGKDEALYVFQRGPRAPAPVDEEMGTPKPIDQGRIENT
ncbi:hypothetical protein GGS24DRAFT_485123 [Hypoxylon argillaceum]|nr:hypothetical protein GGS24DRAFT_485123 [Hypoxylon argillaceum]